MKGPWLGRPEFTRMGNLATCHRTDCRGLHRRHDSRLAGEGHELDLESLAVVVDVDHGSDVADLQAFTRQRRCQHNAIVFSDHVEGSLLAKVGGHEPRCLTTAIDAVDEIRTLPTRGCSPGAERRYAGISTYDDELLGCGMAMPSALRPST
jgi:hypothetical protein